MKRILLAFLVCWSEAAFGQSIGLYADSLGTDCNLVVPYPGGWVTAYVLGTTDESQGIVGASFRIGGLPVGWTGMALPRPGPAAPVVIGNPFVEGVRLAYPVALTGWQILAVLRITPTSVVHDASLVFFGHTDPNSNADCGFEGAACSEPCAHFCTPNFIGLDCLRASSMPTSINGAPCLVATQNWTWERVKSIYK